MLIRLIHKWLDYDKKRVIEVEDKQAIDLIRRGIAEPMSEEVRRSWRKTNVDRIDKY